MVVGGYRNFFLIDRTAPVNKEKALSMKGELISHLIGQPFSIVLIGRSNFRSLSGQTKLRVRRDAHAQSRICSFQTIIPHHQFLSRPHPIFDGWLAFFQIQFTFANR